MFQCPWIPELINRFGDMHMLFDDALIKDGKISKNGTGEDPNEIAEAFKYAFAKPGNQQLSQIIGNHVEYNLNQYILNILILNLEYIRSIYTTN